MLLSGLAPATANEKHSSAPAPHPAAAPRPAPIARPAPVARPAPIARPAPAARAPGTGGYPQRSGVTGRSYAGPTHAGIAPHGPAVGSARAAGGAAGPAPGHIVSRAQSAGTAATVPRQAHPIAAAAPARPSGVTPAAARGADAGHHPATVMRTADGHLAAVSASGRPLGGHTADRPYLHADARPGAPRDRAAVDHDHDFVRTHQDDFRERDVRRLDARDYDRWRGGAWRNEWHYGRRGWWWQVDGVWYPYALPIYPFPLVIAALVVYDTAVVDGPDYDPDAPLPAGGIPPLPPAPVGTYQCSAPAGIYPALDQCASGWSFVPASN